MTVGVSPRTAKAATDDDLSAAAFDVLSGDEESAAFVADPVVDDPSGDAIDQFMARIASRDDETVKRHLQAAIARKLVAFQGSNFDLANAVDFSFLLGLSHSETFNVLDWLDSASSHIPLGSLSDQKAYLMDALKRTRQEVPPASRQRKSRYEK